MKQCLQALQEQTRLPMEAVLIDNSLREPEALKDDLRDLMETLSFPLRILAGPEKGSWAAARNLAVQHCKGEWIAFTDDDCLPAKDWVASIAQLSDAGYDTLGGCVEPTHTLHFPWWWHPEMGWAIGISVPGHHGPKAGSVYYAQTANWASPRSLLLREPFQEIQATFQKGTARYEGGREDAELWRRLRIKGYRPHFDPILNVRHQIPQERVRIAVVLHRAFLDGQTMHRRTPHKGNVEEACNVLASLPGDLLIRNWAGKENILREGAWKIVWAARSAGIVREFYRQTNPRRAFTTLADIFTRQVTNRLKGLLKWTARILFATAMRWNKKRHKTVKQPRKILIAATGYLGDLVLLHPFITGLKSERPEVTIDLITNRLGEQIYRHDPAVENMVILCQDPKVREGTTAIVRFALRQYQPELILVPYWYQAPPNPIFMQNQARVVTFDKEVGLERRVWYQLADRRIQKSPGCHEGANLFRLFREAGFQGPLPTAPLAFEIEEMEAVRRDFEARHWDQFSLVLIAPGTARPNKLWPNERWAEIIRYLIDEYHVSVALIGAPNEKPTCKEIAQLSERRVVVDCDPSVRKAALWISECRLLLAVDNGMKHLAVAMETPTLTLFGPCDEHQWGAIRDPHKHGVVRGCVADLNAEERRGLPENHEMQCIATEQVKRALEEMLEEG